MRSPKPSESELSLLALITKEILVPNGELSPVGDERVAGARVSDRPMFLQTSRANREVTSRGDFRSQIESHFTSPASVEIVEGLRSKICNLRFLGLSLHQPSC